MLCRARMWLGFIAMEKVASASLRKFNATAITKDLAAKIKGALEKLRQANIWHGDMHLGNIHMSPEKSKATSRSRPLPCNHKAPQNCSRAGCADRFWCFIRSVAHSTHRDRTTGHMGGAHA